MSQPPVGAPGSAPQAQPPGPPSGRAGLIATLLETLLAYLDRPWKVLAIIALLIVGGLGWLIWEERPLIRSLITTAGPVSLRADVGPELEDLLQQTAADIVSLWSVDLGSNTQHLVGSRQRGGGLWTVRPQTVPMIQPATDPQRLIAVWAGQPFCAEPEGQSLIIRQLAADGVSWLCIVPVAADSKPVIGVLYIAWRNRPDQGRETANLLIAREVAQRLVMR